MSMSISVFGFKSKKGEILNHWISFVDGFSYSAQEFYARLEDEMVKRNIPSMDISRIEFAQGGILSDKRTYLRMIRERLAFDTCAAPFGNIYFFSCRTVYIPAVVRLWHVLVVLGFFGGLFAVLAYYLDFLLATVAVVALVLAIVQVFRNAVAMGLTDLDSALIKTPVVGPIYERFFRKETYYREDTRLLYLKILPDLVREIAEEAVAAKGLKLTEQYERAPILGELYRPIRTPEAYEFASRADF